MATLSLLVATAGLAATDDRPLEKALRNAAEGGQGAWSLRVDCIGSEHIRGMRLVAGEVGVWDLWTQIHVPETTRRALAEALLGGGFFALEAEYGGKPKPDAAPKDSVPPKEPVAPGEPAARAQRVTCRVEAEVTVDGERLRRSSIQYADGRQSAELKQLANRLLDLVAPLATEGVRPGSFAEALQGLRTGKIDRRLMNARMMGIPPRGADATGLIVRIEEGWASAQPYAPGRLVGDVVRRPVDADTLADLIGQLVSAEFASLPINLWAEQQTELHVEVLGHRHSIYARPFSNLRDRENEVHQSRFEELVASFRQLAETITPVETAR